MMEYIGSNSKPQEPSSKADSEIDSSYMRCDNVEEDGSRKGSVEKHSMLGLWGLIILTKEAWQGSGIITHERHTMYPMAVAEVSGFRQDGTGIGIHCRRGILFGVVGVIRQCPWGPGLPGTRAGAGAGAGTRARALWGMGKGVVVQRCGRRSSLAVPGLDYLLELLFKLPDPFGELLWGGAESAESIERACRRSRGRGRGIGIGRGRRTQVRSRDKTVLRVALVDAMIQQALGASPCLDTFIGRVGTSSGPPRPYTVLTWQLPVATYLSVSTGGASQGWAAAAFRRGCRAIVHGGVSGKQADTSQTVSTSVCC